MNILILIFCVLYFILTIKRLDWAVMVLIAALPSYLIRFQVLGVPFTLLEAMILISFGTWLLKNYKEILNNIKLKLKIDGRRQTADGRKLINYPFGREIIFLLIISYAAVGISGFSDSALGIWKAYFFEPGLLFILILNVFKGKNGINKILLPLLISALAVSIAAIYQKFTGTFIFNAFWAAKETRRVTSFFGYPNAVGLYLGPIILVLLGWLINKFKIQNHKFQINSKFKIQNSKFLIIIAIILSLVSIYFAKSEGALIGVASGLTLFGLLAGGKIRWATAGLVILAAVGIMAYAPAGEYSIKKITLKDLSGEIRKAQWAETMEMLKDGRLIIGAGLANYQKAVKPYHQEGIFFNKDNDPDFRRKIVLFNEKYKSEYWQPTEIYLYPHNIFLNFWTELGFIGMLLFIWIIGKYFVTGIKTITNYELRITNNKFLIIGLICAMAVIVVHGLVDVPYFKNDLAAMFWIFAAMMGIISLKQKKIRRGGRAVEGATLEKS